MQEYEQSQKITAPANEVFAWVSDVENLPKYLPPIKDAGIDGPAEGDNPGEKVKMRVEIPDRGEFMEPSCRSTFSLASPLHGRRRSRRVAGPPAEGYGGGQGDGAEHDQERRGGEVDRDPELRQRREDRVHHDRRLSDRAEHVDTGRPAHQPGDELGQKAGKNQGQDGRYDVRDVGYKLAEDRRPARVVPNLFTAACGRSSHPRGRRGLRR